MAALRNRRERRRIAIPSAFTMTSCRHHSGYLADDEAGHTTYVARVSVSGRALTPEIPPKCSPPAPAPQITAHTHTPQCLLTSPPSLLVTSLSP